MINTTISHYRIFKLLGEGGMGQVYLAEDTNLGRLVAIKVLHPKYNADPDFLARFKREARATAKLNHPNIVTIHEIDEHDGITYIVMEYVDGESLKDLIRREKLPIPQVLGIVKQIGAGLKAAHQLGIVHRDIKPANILLNKTGQVKITDFGIAKLQDTVVLTQSSRTMGTPHYMAPEQVRGEKVDMRADIFSFGVLLWEMLARQLPFTGDTGYAIMFAIAQKEPAPLADFNPDVSKNLQTIIDRCLQKNVERRYQNVEELFRDLRAEEQVLLTGQNKTRTIFIEKFREPFSFKRLLKFFSFEAQKAKEKPLSEKPSSPLSKEERTFLQSHRKPILSKAEKAKEGIPLPEKPHMLIPAEVEKAKEGTPILEKPHKPIPPEAEKSSSPPPIEKSEDSPSIDQPSLFLKPEHYSLTNYANKRIIEDIILYEDFERLKSFITDSEGGRFVLTGYGRFGGTSLVKGAMERAKRELKKRGMREGDLLTFNFNIKENSGKTEKFEINDIDFGFGTLSTQDEKIKKIHLSTPLGNTFFGKAALKDKSNEFDYHESIKQLKKLLAEDADDVRLREIVFELLGNENLPARVILILDKIWHLEILESLAQFELFKNKKITVIAVTRKEEFDKWERCEQRLNKIEFKKWYVPCISLKETAFIQKISQVLLKPHLIQNSESEDSLVHLRKHLEFVGKGILGEVLEELKHPQYWSGNKNGGFYLRLDTLPHQRNITHNAWMQDVLSENWLEISGKLFPKDEEEDRARISCYHLVDWMVKNPIFLTEKLFDAALNDVPITVSENHEVLTEVVENLLQVLLNNSYLKLISNNRYRLQWDSSAPPKLKKGPIKKLRPKTPIQSFQSFNEVTSFKAAGEPPIHEEAGKPSNSKMVNVAEIKNSDKSVMIKKRQVEKITEEEYAPIKESLLSSEGEKMHNKTKILAVFANPKGSDRLRLDEEDRIIRTSIERSKNRDNLHYAIRHAARIKDVMQALVEDDYHIVQFSGHATKSGNLALEDEIGNPKLIPQQALADLLSEFKSVECVILNACYSLRQGQSISLGVPFTIAMDGPISDEAAKHFIQGFYDTIGAGRDYRLAYKMGCNIISMEGLKEKTVPQFLENKPN